MAVIVVQSTLIVYCRPILPQDIEENIIRIAQIYLYLVGLLGALTLLNHVIFFSVYL